jgi:hypothetical protein
VALSGIHFLLNPDSEIIPELVKALDDLNLPLAEVITLPLEVDSTFRFKVVKECMPTIYYQVAVKPLNHFEKLTLLDKSFQEEKDNE